MVKHSACETQCVNVAAYEIVAIEIVIARGYARDAQSELQWPNVNTPYLLPLLSAFLLATESIKLVTLFPRTKNSLRETWRDGLSSSEFCERIRYIDSYEPFQEGLYVFSFELDKREIGKYWEEIRVIFGALAFFFGPHILSILKLTIVSKFHWQTFQVFFFKMLCRILCEWSTRYWRHERIFPSKASDSYHRKIKLAFAETRAW